MRQIALPRRTPTNGVTNGSPARSFRLRRPSFTIRRPTPEQAITFGVLAAAVVFVFSQLHPSLIFANTTPAGGDMGAHVWGPAYMRDHLLPHFRLTGWAPSWYDGFPAFQFYFPLPSLVIVVLDVLLPIPYGVAFKVVTILGLLSLPVCAWAFGKLSGMRFPGPVVLAVATVPYLFDRGFTIYGGNIPSTLAGEFSFSISLSLALLFLGVVARGLDTGKHRALAAVLLALTGLSHLLPTIFAVLGALVLLLLRPGRRRVKLVGAVLGVGALLAAFWSLPFLVRLPYANNMGWEKETRYFLNLFRLSGPALAKAGLPAYPLTIFVVLAAVGVVCSVAYRRRTGLFLFGMAAVCAAIFIMAPQGRLWNARALPFWYLCVYLLAGVGVTELGVAAAKLFAADPQNPSPWYRRATPLVAAFAAWMFVGVPLGVVPKWLPDSTTKNMSFIPAWAKWNYSGYERKDAYPEYSALIKTMAEVGRTNGCGRAHWEYDANLDRFGTPMALMLLPYWTDGCIDSMEGLYFESSATTPYHFIDAAELSKAPSNPQRDLPYPTLDVAAGVEHLKLMGTRYYMAFSPEAIAQADRVPDLKLVATTGNWRIYEVQGSELVTPLAFKPAVVTGVTSGEHPWIDLSVDWYLDPNAHDVPLTASGPKDWPRVALHTVQSPNNTIGAKVAVDTPPREPVPMTGVKHIKTTDDSISFDVDRPGSPVLVKVSDYPNWKASGAKGPYRVTPNLMVVVPTKTHVTMHYGYTSVDILGYVLSIAGVVLVVRFLRSGPVDLDPEPTEHGPEPAQAPKRRREDLEPALSGGTGGAPPKVAAPDRGG
jgi:hypothetical protein